MGGCTPLPDNSTFPLRLPLGEDKGQSRNTRRLRTQTPRSGSATDDRATQNVPEGYDRHDEQTNKLSAHCSKIV